MELENDQRVETKISREPELGREPERELELEPEPEREPELELEPELEPMTKLEFDKLVGEGFRLLPGRCAIHLERPPDKVGAIVIPQSAQAHEVKAEGYVGTVLAVTPEGIFRYLSGKVRGKPTDFSSGDRVCVGLHADELTEEVVIIRNTMVAAVLW